MSDDSPTVRFEPAFPAERDDFETEDFNVVVNRLQHANGKDYIRLVFSASEITLSATLSRDHARSFAQMIVDVVDAGIPEPPPPPPAP